MQELLKGESVCDIKEVTEAVEKSVLFYNTEALHEHQYDDILGDSHSYRQYKERMD